jgi:D-alanyl-D-alanine carboxypeptidase
LATLASYALENELFREICGTKNVTIGNRTLQNHNKLLWSYEGTVGVKTGFTKAAGRILVSAAEKNGRRLIAVTLRAPNDWQDHTKLLDYGFTRFQSQSVVEGGEILHQIPVLSGAESSVGIVAKESVSCPVREGETLILRYHIPRFVYAPVEEHTLAGYAEVLVDGELICKIPLTYEKTVEQSVRKKRALFRFS